MEIVVSTNFILDNEVVSSSDFNRKQLSNGIVIYEVIRVSNSIPLFLGAHIDRFIISINKLGVKTNVSISTIASRISTLININNLSIGNIRFQLCFSKNSQTTFSAWIVPHSYPDKELYITGIKVATLASQRNNPNLKIFNSNFKSSISKHKLELGVYELLLVNEIGLVTEGSKSNIFFLKENTLITPKTEQVLPGITRMKVIQIAGSMGIKLLEKKISSTSLKIYDSAFISGTSPKILPIRNIDEIQFNTKNDTINKVMDEYELMVAKDMLSFNWDHYTNGRLPDK